MKYITMLVGASLLTVALGGCDSSSSETVRYRDAFRPGPRLDSGINLRPRQPVMRPDMATPDAGIDMGVREPVMHPGVLDAIDPADYIPYGKCPEAIEYTGQVTGSNMSIPNGGTARFDPYPEAYDSGIAEVLARVPAPARNDDPDPVAVTDLKITKATVVATRTGMVGMDDGLAPSQGGFWIADGQSTIEVYLNLAADKTPPFSIRVGQVISFKVTQVGRFGERAQIQAGTDWSSHTGDVAHVGLTPDPAGDVHIYEPDGQLRIGDVGRVIRITGLLQGDPESDNDPLTPQECGRGFSCWLFNYTGQMDSCRTEAGDLSPGCIVYRTPEADIRPGTCVTYVGPLSAYRGTLQLEAFNPEWVRHYQRGAEFGEECTMSPECTTGVCLNRRDAMGVETSTCSLQCSDDSDCECPSDEPCPLRYHVCVQNRCLPSQGVKCPETITYAGQYGGADTRVPNGGTLRQAPYPVDYDAGIGNILAAIPPATADGDPPPQSVNIPISKAIVVDTAAFSDDSDTAPNQVNFWIADGTGFMEVSVDPGTVGGRPQDFFVRTGEVISFRATEVRRRYLQRPQIIYGVDWVKHDMDEPPHPTLSAGPNTEIPVEDINRPLTTDDIHRIIRVTGTVSRDPYDCGGGNRCWKFDYGQGSPVILRTSTPDLRSGGCATYIGPVGYFKQRDRAGILQLDTVNLDWIRVYN